MSLNFNNVESAGVKVEKESTFKVIKPGVQPLTITAIEPTLSSKKQTPGVVVTFTGEDASFTENFWLTAGAFGRVKYLVEKFTGVAPTEEFSSEGLDLATEVANLLAVKLIGKTKEIVVDGEVRSREKDGKVYDNTYPTLRYAGFVEPEGTAAEPIITKVVAETAPAASILDSTDQNSDLPF